MDFKEWREQLDKWKDLIQKPKPRFDLVFLPDPFLVEMGKLKAKLFDAMAVPPRLLRSPLNDRKAYLLNTDFLKLGIAPAWNFRPAPGFQLIDARENPARCARFYYPRWQEITKAALLTQGVMEAHRSRATGMLNRVRRRHGRYKPAPEGRYTSKWLTELSLVGLPIRTADSHAADALIYSLPNLTT